MPPSTSRIESPRRRRTQPQPPLEESEVGSRESEEGSEVGGRRSDDGPRRAGPASASPETPQSGPAARKPRRSSRRSTSNLRPPTSAVRRPTRRPPPRLSETAGPEPGAAPGRVFLTVGTILAPHGVRGEFKLRLHSDDPEHLLTVKRLYLGDETTPRTVLGVRLHAGHALMRLQGISSPETVDRLRGTPVRMRGSDARPLAPNEYFLYQVIGLAAFDEAGNRLGAVTDLLETGANEVLIVTPDDGGANLLFPSHPDVVLELDPAAGRVVLRPLRYYGE